MGAAGRAWLTGRRSEYGVDESTPWRCQLVDHSPAETLNLIGKKFSRGLAIDTGKLLLTEPSFVIGTTHGDRHAQALELFKNTPAGVSYTDCLVMVTADEHQTPYVLGFDDLFRKRGYTVPGGQKKEAA